MRKFEHTFNTSGDGFWSTAKKSVKTTEINLAYMNDEKDFGELRVYFDTKTWNVDTDGLIYTDKLFIGELWSTLYKEGYNIGGVSYSEQGMQGDNYVSLDVGPDFINSWFKNISRRVE